MSVLQTVSPHTVHLFVRWVHVASVAVLVGGAVLAWGQLRGVDRDLPETARTVLVTYEWLFWAAVGFVVLTGVGNLGSMGSVLPGPGTSWGGTLAVKLSVVVGLLVGSVVRTAAVVRAGALENPGGAVRIRVAYAATAVTLFGLVALAEVLAHG